MPSPDRVSIPSTLSTASNEGHHVHPVRTKELLLLLEISAKLALAQLAPLVMSLYLAGLIVRRDELVFSSYSLVNAVNLTVFIAASSFLQGLYYFGGRALGRSDVADYQSVMRAGTIVALVIGGLACVISGLIGPTLSLLNYAPKVVAYANSLGMVAAMGLLPAFVLVVYRVHASLSGYAGVVSGLAIVGALAGIALASIVATQAGNSGALANRLLWVLALVNWAMLIAAALSMRLVPQMSIAAAYGRPSKEGVFTQIWSFGWPVGAVVLLDNFFTLSSSLIIGRFWVDALPMHSIVLLWVTVGLVVPLGISQAAVQRVSVLHAQGQHAQRNRVAIAAIALSVVWGVIVALLFTLFAEIPGSLMLLPDSRTEQTRAFLGAFMPPAGLVLALQGVVIVGAAILRGLGQTRALLVLALIGYLGAGTAGQALFVLTLGMGAVGVWWGLVFGFVATTAAVLIRCRTQLRKQPLSPLRL